MTTDQPEPPAVELETITEILTADLLADELTARLTREQIFNARVPAHLRLAGLLESLDARVPGRRTGGKAPANTPVPGRLAPAVLVAQRLFGKHPAGRALPEAQQVRLLLARAAGVETAQLDSLRVAIERES